MFLTKKKGLMFLLTLFLMIVIVPRTLTHGTAFEEFESPRFTRCFFDPDIIIPDDYPTIQEGINQSDPYDNIFVRSGIYEENIIVDKTGVYIKGENKLNTTIDGKKTSKNTITISSPDITIQGFSIINGQNQNTGPWGTAGIQIASTNVTINDNLIMRNLLGISAFYTAYNLTIINNSFTGNSILLGYYEDTPLTYTVDGFLHTITNNTVNGKPLYYFKNTDNFTVPTDAGQIILANCTNGSIKDTYISQADFPVILGFCSQCVIENLTIDDTYGEFILFNSDNCTIQNNTVSHVIYGICLDYKSEYNVVQFNEVSHNYGGIVVMMSARNNTVYHNYIHDNSWGIFLLESAYNNIISGNEIYDNYIGIRLEHDPYDNIISNNTIKKCLFAALSIGRTTNYWCHNYWNRLRLLPKPIFAYTLLLNTIPIPYMITGVDWYPAKAPYELS